MRKSLAATGVIAVSLLALTACSSSSSSSTPSGGSSSGGGNAGTAAAAAYLQPFLSSPTSIGFTTPLSKKPAAGKLIVGLDNGTDSNKVLSQYWAQAAADLGWTFKDVNVGVTPDTQQKGMEAALALNPAGIATSGILATTLKVQLAAAAAAGIKVNSSASTDPESPTGFFDTSIASPADIVQSGKQIAAFVIGDTNGAAKVQMFTLPVYPILLKFDDGFKAGMAQWCPACTMQENPQQGADIGTNTPGSVVSSLQKNPDTNWVTFDLGDLSTGVDPAIAAAGLSSSVGIGGLTGTKANIQAVKDGKEKAWTSYSLPLVAYRQIDSFAREFNGDTLINAAIPGQVITPTNVNSLVLDSAGNYLGVTDYQVQFKKLWLVG